jgi:competence protein ComEC
MAISGLHLGIVMLVVGSILLPVNLIFWGWHIRAALIVVVLWLFAAVSGFSPSVVRSAIMLTVLQLSAASVLRYNTMNALSVVVIAMLVWSPDYLYDISFQLSVLAVMGIVLWGVPLLSILGRRQIPGMSIITTVVVSLTATLWSMPLVAHAFSQVCFVNVIISPVVFITAYVVVGFGIFALVLPEALALPFARVMEAAAMFQNDVVARGAEWGYGFMMGSLSAWEMVAIYALFALITLVGCSWEEKKMITLHINE